jgi:hypothetical protein
VRILQAATAQAVTCARTNPKGLSQAAKITASSMPNFVKTANVAMGVAPDAGVRDAVMNDTRQVIDMVQKVLEDARTRVAPTRPPPTARSARPATRCRSRSRRCSRRSAPAAIRRATRRSPRS